MKFGSDSRKASVESTPENKLYFKNPSLLNRIYIFLQRVK